MVFNFYALLGAAFVPALLGLVWFNGAVFGKAAGFNEQQLAGANRPLVLVLSVVFGFFVALVLTQLSIHQFGFGQLLANDEPAVQEALTKEFMEKYGDRFRSFGHGALHGTIAALFLAFPLFGLQTMREGRGWKYFGAHAGFWLVCFAIMGALVCGIR